MAITNDGMRVATPLKKARALLGYLALREGNEIPRSVLTGLLWGERNEEQARGSLRQTLSEVRAALADSAQDSMIATKETVTWVSGSAWIDAKVLESAAASSDEDTLRKAADLIGGELMEGLSVNEPAFEQWLVTERERFRLIACGIYARLQEQAEQGGKLEEALSFGLKRLSLDPLQENVYRTLMRLYAAQGRHDAALAQYERCRRELSDQLGVEPDSETESLVRAIRANRRERSIRLRIGASFPLERNSRQMACTSGRPSIAVLPFLNLSDDPKQNYLADGLTEDVISELARYRDHIVIDRNSAFALKGMANNPSELRAKLGVRYAVQGTLRRYGERIRVTAQLFDLPSNSQVWAEHYERDVAEFFLVQDELIQTIAGALAGWMERRVRDDARRKATPTLDAYECFIQGRERFFRMNPEDNRVARELFEKAIAIDENYAAAHSWLAETHVGDWAGGWSPSPHRSLELGLRCAETALSLDDADSRTHATFARAVCYLRQYDKARFHFNRALSINPSDTWALVNSARCYVLDGLPITLCPKLWQRHGSTL